MENYYPSYQKSFRCLAGDCPDSCCKAWEICIDERTEKYYRALPGEYGEHIRARLTKDEDGDTCFCLENGRCPFLNENGLCDIHIRLGVEHTSDVCRQHPLFIEEYDGFTEICPSVSCPAACELIFSEELTGNVYPCPAPESSGDELLRMLLRGRKTALEAAARYNFPESAARIYALSSDLQEIWDCFSPEKTAYDLDAVLTDDVYKEYDITADRRYKKTVCKFVSFLLEQTEILTEEWRTLLKTALQTPSPREKRAYDENVRRAFRYFLYRYYLKPVNDEDIMLWTMFCILSVSVCAEISDRTGTDFRETVRLYSKETEHDTVNIERIAEFIAENE